jgi:hypothetical protein
VQGIGRRVARKQSFSAHLHPLRASMFDFCPSMGRRA